MRIAQQVTWRAVSTPRTQHLFLDGPAALSFLLEPALGKHLPSMRALGIASRSFSSVLRALGVAEGGWWGRGTLVAGRQGMGGAKRQVALRTLRSSMDKAVHGLVGLQGQRGVPAPDFGTLPASLRGPCRLGFRRQCASPTPTGVVVLLAVLLAELASAQRTSDGQEAQLSAGT